MRGVITCDREERGLWQVIRRDSKRTVWCHYVGLDWWVNNDMQPVSIGDLLLNDDSSKWLK